MSGQLLCSTALLSMLLTVPLCRAACSVGDVYICMEVSGISDYVEDADSVDTTKFTLSSSELMEYCRRFSQYKQCLTTRVIPGCGFVDRAIMNGLFDSMHYFCNETIDDYVFKYQSCFIQEKTVRGSSHSVLTELLRCEDQMKSELSGDENFNDMCETEKRGINCQVDAVRDACGSPAAGWYRVLVSKSVKYLNEATGCSYVDEDESIDAIAEKAGAAPIGDNVVEVWGDYEDEIDAFDVYSTKKPDGFDDRYDVIYHDDVIDRKDVARNNRVLVMCLVSLSLVLLITIAIKILLCTRQQTRNARRRMATADVISDDAPPSYEDHVIVVDDKKTLMNEE